MGQKAAGDAHSSAIVTGRARGLTISRKVAGGLDRTGQRTGAARGGRKRVERCCLVRPARRRAFQSWSAQSITDRIQKGADQLRFRTDISGIVVIGCALGVLLGKSDIELHAVGERMASGHRAALPSCPLTTKRTRISARSLGRFSGEWSGHAPAVQGGPEQTAVVARYIGRGSRAWSVVAAPADQRSACHVQIVR